jgi:hypothetical protein
MDGTANAGDHGETHSKPKPRALATLVILSATRSVEELLALIPLEPDETWQRGSLRAGGRSTHSLSGLSFSSRAERAAPPEVHIDDLLQRVMVAQQAIRAFAEGSPNAGPDPMPVRFWINVETSRPEVGIDIRPDQVAGIRELGAALGVEVEGQLDAFA